MKTRSSLILLLAAVFIPCSEAHEERGTSGGLHCTRTGFFPIDNSCYEYYECYLWRGNLFLKPHECPQETFFDASSSTCQPVTLSTTPISCRSNPSDGADVPQDIVPTSKPVVIASEVLQGVINESIELSHGNDTLNFPLAGNVTENSTAFSDGAFNVVENTTTTSSNETTGDLVEDMTPPPPRFNVCEHINVVNRHVTLLTSPPVRESLQRQTTFNELVRGYNTVLGTTQNNTLVWRNGESILNGIKNTYKLASEYHGEFNRKYSVYQTQITKETNNEELIENIREDISRIQTEIEENQGALNLTSASSVRKFFLNNIEKKKKELESKEQELRMSSKVAQDLAELLHFLNFVKTDAMNIENIGKHTNNRLKSLSQDYESDLNTLEKFLTQVSDSVQSLTEEEKGYETERSSFTERQNSLETQKQKLNEEMSDLNTVNNENLKQMKKVQAQIDKLEDSYNKKIEILCDLKGQIQHKLGRNYTDEDIRRACNEILASNFVELDTLAEREEMRTLINQNEQNRLRILRILKEIENANQEIIKLMNATPALRTEIQNTRTESANLHLLFEDLMQVTLSARKANESLSEISNAFQELYPKFEHLEKEINLMILLGQGAEDDQARIESKEVIQQKLSEIKLEILSLEDQHLEKCH